MIYFIIMIIFSPFTAIIPAIYTVGMLIRKKIKVEKNYWNISLFLLFAYSVFSGIVISISRAVFIFCFKCVLSKLFCEDK